MFNSKRMTILLSSVAVVAFASPAMADGVTVKFGGFIKAVGSFSSYSTGEPSSTTIRDFYAGQFIPTGAGDDYNAFTSNVKQSRITTTIESDVGGRKVKGYVEYDFQAGLVSGSQTATNAYNPALRRAYIQFENWTIGQDWSTFQNPAVLPESTDYAGTLDGTVFVRQPLVRYTHKLSPNATFMISAENSETLNATTTSGTSTANDDDKLPDLAARIAFKNSIGEFSIGAVARKLSVVSGTYDESATGAGVSASGVIPFGVNKQHKATFMVTYGDGIGRYVAAAPVADVVRTASGLDTISTTNALASVKFGVSPKSRINVMLGYHETDLPNSVTSASTYTKKLQSAAVNYFYSPVKGVDFGVEYRHAEHERFGGADGSLDRLEFAAKYSF